MNWFKFWLWIVLFFILSMLWAYLTISAIYMLGGGR